VISLLERIAIVGSRRRTDRSAVEAAIRELPPTAVVISGGCRGPDRWAAEAARARRLPVVEHLPELPPAGSPRWAFTRAYHARNQRIVDDCHAVVAFVAPDRLGGTEDTIRRAKAAGKPVQVR
jgi:YspA, cpYpsA-related SLOG family